MAQPWTGQVEAAGTGGCSVLSAVQAAWLGVAEGADIGLCRRHGLGLQRVQIPGFAGSNAVRTAYNVTVRVLGLRVEGSEQRVPRFCPDAVVQSPLHPDPFSVPAPAAIILAFPNVAQFGKLTMPAATIVAIIAVKSQSWQPG
eukprot:160355-Chlamydomonas_euryale.AAC.1